MSSLRLVSCMEVILTTSQCTVTHISIQLFSNGSSFCSISPYLNSCIRNTIPTTHRWLLGFLTSLVGQSHIRFPALLFEMDDICMPEPNMAQKPSKQHWIAPNPWKRMNTMISASKLIHAPKGAANEDVCSATTVQHNRLPVHNTRVHHTSNQRAHYLSTCLYHIL